MGIEALAVPLGAGPPPGQRDYPVSWAIEEAAGDAEACIVGKISLLDGLRRHGYGENTHDAGRSIGVDGVARVAVAAARP